MYCSEALVSKISLRDLTDKIKYDSRFRKDHPDYFDPDGVIVFTGSQGSGKTLSAVRYIDNLCKLYPKAILVSNCGLHLPSYHGDVLPYSGIPDLSRLDNGIEGIICFIDEIQTEFSSLESAKLHPSTLSLISMQRKRRLHIVGTSQILKRIAKPWREQLSAVVDCSCLLGALQINAVVDFSSISEDPDGNLTAYKYNGRRFFFRSPRYYDMYDTFERVKRIGIH